MGDLAVSFDLTVYISVECHFSCSFPIHTYRCRVSWPSGPPCSIASFRFAVMQNTHFYNIAFLTRPACTLSRVISNSDGRIEAMEHEPHF